MKSKQELFQNACIHYNHLADSVEEIYGYLAKKSLTKVKKKLLMDDFDHYIQDLLIAVSCGDNVVQQAELEFAKKIVRYKDFYKSYESNENNLMKLDGIKKLVEENLKNVPLFIQMFVAADKILEEDGVPMHFCSETFNALINIIYDISAIDETVSENEIQEACGNLSAVMSYFNINNIDFIKKGE